MATYRLATRRGTMPACEESPADPAFSSECVLPLPVWPYAKMHPAEQNTHRQDVASSAAVSSRRWRRATRSAGARNASNNTTEKRKGKRRRVPRA